MHPRPFRDAVWISRPAPASQRIAREIVRDRIDWAGPGRVLSQEFVSTGAICAVAVDLAAPEDVPDPFAADVAFTLTLETASGEVIARRAVDRPQLVWERFGRLLDVTPAAPPGSYAVVLRVERGTVGWHTARARGPEADDGVSPLPINGRALSDGAPVPGTRLIAVDTEPAANPLFRGAIDIDGAVEEATLHAVVLGCGFVRINGRRVGEPGIEPAVTDYDKTVFYRSQPIAHLLRQGHNEILIEAGRERYSARGGDIWGWNVAPWHREPAALAEVTVRYRDGSTLTVQTGTGWEAAAGPVVSDILFRGETWVLSDDEPEWEPAAVVDGPSGKLRPAGSAQMRASSPLPPVTSTRLGERGTVYDFGRVMTGRVRCTVKGGPGSRIRVVSGEQLDAAGNVICENVLVAGPAQEDILELARTVVEQVWEPQFGYRGFRWMQVITEGDVEVSLVRAVPISTPVETVGELDTSAPLLEWIDTALARTFMNNLHGIPTDTPIYEKNGWTADAHLATEALLHHFDLREAFGKWMDDHVDAQSADGAIPQIVPTPGWGRSADPAWAASAVLIPWYLYREYGDIALLRRYAPMIRRFADHLLARSGTGLWPDRSWGDWLAPGYAVGPEGMAPIGTAMEVAVLRQTAEILREIGDAETSRYDHAANAIAEAYHEAYFDTDLGCYRVTGVAYRQSLNILPLAFGMVPPQDVAAVRASLIADLEQRTDGHLDCGAIAVRHLLPVLADAGRDDLALTVLMQRSRPGWGAWFNDGESTLLESWDPDARSRNHYFLGSVASWIQQRVGGLRLTSPGWASFAIEPVADDRVTSARIRHRTPHGDAMVEWERGPGGWNFTVLVPDGSTATLAVEEVRTRLPQGTHCLFVPLGASTVAR